MKLKKFDWNKLKNRLNNVYRFQIVDEKTYDVKLVLELKPLNILIGIGLILAFFTILNFMLIAFTPLKQYIPGYGSSSSNKEIVNLRIKTEELAEKIKSNNKYVTNIKNILSDKIVVDAVKTNMKKIDVDTGILSIKTTDESKFVAEIEKGLKNAELLENIDDTKKSALNDLHLLKPVNGSVSLPYNSKLNNLNITFNTSKNETVKAPLDGTVILIGKTIENADYMIVQSENQLVYILNNITQISKKTGNFVKSGEIIAKTAKQNNSNNYICIFELWYKGQSINPTKFIK